MHKLQLYFTIFTCLCVAFSSRASSFDDWTLNAAKCERDAYVATDAAQANAALLARAACCFCDSRYEDALHALERVNVFALDESGASELLKQKLLCAYLLCSFKQAEGFEEEILMLSVNSGPPAFASHGDSLVMLGQVLSLDSLLARTRELAIAAAPELKSESIAVARGFLPPLGHTYTGHTARGIAFAGLNLASLAYMVVECASGDWFSGLFGGGMLLYNTFFKEQLNVASWVIPWNEAALNAAKLSVSASMAKDLNDFFSSKYNSYVRKETGKDR